MNEYSKVDYFVPGMLVEIIADEDKATQESTRGYIKEILSKKDNAKGIRVRLTNGKVGRIVYVPTKNEVKTENFKFYNLFFYDPNIYSLWHKKDKKYLVINKINKITGRPEKIAFLFNDREAGLRVLNGLQDRELMLRPINRKKPIVENFKTLTVEYFSINTTRKLSYEKLIEWESYFKNMR